MTPPDDPRAAIARLVVRLRAAADADRPAVVGLMLPLLADMNVPLAVRFAAAARAIDALPDTPAAVRAVVRAVTAGLTPARALHRLRHLQHLTEQGHALDALVAAREAKVRSSCPRCAARLSRAEMAKHLWHRHGLALVNGKTRTRGRAVEAVRREHAATGDPALFDRAADLGGEPAVRAWAAETASEEESLPICAAARERGAGVCPKCFADVVPGVPDLPPPLAVAHGRIAGDGFVATAPGAFPARVTATLAAAAVLVAVTALVHVALGFVLAIGAYFATLLRRLPRTPADDRAIDAAWRELAPKSIDRRDAARFLTRLCVTSVGRGDPLERANALQRLIARARADPAERRLLAVALALEMDDGGRFGRDRAAGIADLVATAFRGEHPADFAEHVLAAYAAVPREPGERARLRVLLYAGAFGAGLAPRDAIDLCDAAPHVASAMRLPPHHVALLYGVWVNRTARPWASAGDAQTVFELAATSPATAALLLADAPGVLLVCGTPPGVEAELGPVLVTTVGVSVGGAVTPDPAADVRVEDGGRELVFGTRRFRLDRAIPEGFAGEVKAWLRFRAGAMAAYPATYLHARPPPVSRLLVPFAVRCAACGTECAPVVGAVAKVLRA